MNARGSILTLHFTPQFQ